MISISVKKRYGAATVRARISAPTIGEALARAVARLADGPAAGEPVGSGTLRGVKATPLRGVPTP